MSVVRGERGVVSVAEEPRVAEEAPCTHLMAACREKPCVANLLEVYMAPQMPACSPHSEPMLTMEPPLLLSSQCLTWACRRASRVRVS